MGTTLRREGCYTEVAMTLQRDTLEFEAFNVLSLDGGGLKGIYSAAVLAALEEDFGVRVVDHVDLIAGTSTCLLYTSPSPRDLSTSRMPSSA